MTAAAIILILVTLQRGAELLLSRRNTAALMARGALEIGAGQYPLMVAFHATWLIALFLFGRNQGVDPFWFCVYLGLQAFRAWVMMTLGARWTTRIIVLPNAPLITSGPYRFFRHPNYAVVAAEIAVLPLTLGLPSLAALFTVLNTIVLVIRIRSEDRVLAAARS